MAYVYDGLGRISRCTVNAGGTGVATTYGYLAGGHGTNSTTPLVQTITQSGTTLTYTYDDTGNITSVSDGAKTISHEYDLLGQLTRVGTTRMTPLPMLRALLRGCIPMIWAAIFKAKSRMHLLLAPLVLL